MDGVRRGFRGVANSVEIEGLAEPLVEFETELPKHKKRALNIVSARPITRNAMEKRLKELGESAENAAEAADWLADIGLIDDAAYAAEVVRVYTKRGYGLQRVRDELYKKMVPRELWDEALSEICDGEPVAAAVEFIARKMRGELPDFDDRRRVGAALVRRGHSWDDINSAFAKYAENLEEDEEFH